MRLPIIVINTNLPPFLRRLRDIAFDTSEIAIMVIPLALNSPDAWVPLGHLCKIVPGRQRMAKVGYFEPLSRAHERYRQTDGRATTTIFFSIFR